MKRYLSRLTAVMSLASLMVVMMASVALAQEEITSAIEGAAADVQSTVVSVLPEIFGVAAFLLVIGVAWRFFRRFVR